MNKYKIKLIKTYDFELIGKNKEDVERKVFEKLKYGNILDSPKTKKRLRLKIKVVKERINKYEKDN